MECYAYPPLILIILLQVFLTTLSQQELAATRGLQYLRVRLDQVSGGIFFTFLAVGTVNWLNLFTLRQ